MNGMQTPGAPAAPTPPAAPAPGGLDTILQGVVQAVGAAIGQALIQSLGTALAGAGQPATPPAAPAPPAAAGGLEPDGDEPGAMGGEFGPQPGDEPPADAFADDEDGPELPGMDLGDEGDFGDDDEDDESEPRMSFGSDRDDDCMDADCMDMSASDGGKERNEMTAPSGSNTHVPRSAGPRRPGVARYQRDGEPDRYQRLERDNQALRRQVEDLTQRVEQAELERTYLDRYQRLEALRTDGYLLDPKKELEDTEDFSDPQFESHLGRIQQNYTKSVAPPQPARYARSIDDAGSRRRGDELSPEQGRKVARYCAQNGLRYEEGLRKLREESPEEFGDV